MQRFSLRSGGPVIGLMVDWLDDTYQQMVVHGALAAARDRGVHLVCFVGGQMQAEGNGSRQEVYDLIGPESVDALIVMSGALVNLAGADVLSTFAERFRGVPMVSVASRVLEDTPLVTVDNREGMRRAVAHIVRDHGMQSVAYIHGPEANQEAEMRLATFREVMAEHGAPVRDRFVLQGDWSVASGVSAISQLFGERGAKPETVQAVIAANDNMAMGALLELARRGIRVPDQIAVVGFDDVEDTRYTHPPLTTVRQPLAEQGREALRMALAAQRGEKVDDVVLRTEMVARRSCGCFPHEIQPVQAISVGHGFDAALIERRQVLLAELARAAQGRFGSLAANWEARLVNAFAESLRGGPARFVELVDDIVRQLSDAGGDIGAFHEVISTLRRELLPCIGDGQKRALGEALLDEARRLAASASERREARGRLDALRYGADFALTAANVTASFSQTWLHDSVLPGLRVLGIREAVVARYVNDRSAGALVEVTASSHQRPLLGHRGRARDVVRLLANDSDGLCVAPLFGEGRQYGFAVFHLGVRPGFGYEALRSLLSSALDAQELRRRVAELEGSRR